MCRGAIRVSVRRCELLRGWAHQVFGTPGRRRRIPCLCNLAATCARALVVIRGCAGAERPTTVVRLSRPSQECDACSSEKERAHAGAPPMSSVLAVARRPHHRLLSWQPLRLHQQGPEPALGASEPAPAGSGLVVEQAASVPASMALARPAGDSAADLQYRLALAPGW